MANDEQMMFPSIVEDEASIPKQEIVVRGEQRDVYKRNYKDLFWQFIYERHMIWYKRFVLKLPAPWTADQILLEYKFTNMYRELDKGTLYLLDYIIGPVEKLGQPSSQIFNTIMYRVFNRIDAWEAIRHLTAGRDDKAYRGAPEMPWHRQQMVNILRHRQDVLNLPIYTDAHMVCAYNGTPGHDKLARIENIFNAMEKDHLDSFVRLVNSAKSLQPIWQALKDMHGLGPFLAYEIAVDISYAPWNNLSENEWVNPGPGCQIGINILYPETKPKDCSRKIFELRGMQQDEFKRLGLPFADIAYKGRWLTLRNVEHNLCEFQKYVKALDKTGRPRNRFRPVSWPGQPIFDRLRGE